MARVIVLEFDDDDGGLADAVVEILQPLQDDGHVTALSLTGTDAAEIMWTAEEVMKGRTWP